MMGAKKNMEELSVSEILDNYNLIVPEIQREYVWGFNYNGIIETFIDDIKETRKNNQNNDVELIALENVIANTSDIKTKQTIQKLLNDKKSKGNELNIGFLYSYRPDYYVFNDRNEDVYLIDGQQRFTTLFLFLFYFSLKEIGKKQDFIQTFRFNKKEEFIAFDYRVRTETHNFFIDLISKSNTVEDLLNIEKKNWFLKNYKQDTTVKSIVGDSEKEDSIGVFKLLEKHFKNDTDEYYDFIKSNIRFWHFKTEETSQGEELYITMNSRGQQLADNENLRAKLFENPSIKSNQLEWSKKWEEWQDFFWKNRDKRDKEATADNGFNDFLRWIVIVQMILDGKKIEDRDSILKNVLKGHIEQKHYVEYLNLSLIEKYFKALVKLFKLLPENINSFNNRYLKYNKFNLLPREWIFSSSSGLKQIQLYRILPVLYYCYKVDIEFESVEYIELFRIIRFFYNTSKSEIVAKTPDDQVINAINIVRKINVKKGVISILDLEGISKTILTEEEKEKFELYNIHKNREEIESYFWYSEDLEFNDGRIHHLIEWTKDQNERQFSIDKFKGILESFEFILVNEDFIWGDLFITDIYKDNSDRITYNYEYHTLTGFKDITLEVFNSSQKLNEKLLASILLNRRKNFIRERYRTIEDIQSEKSSKNQVYIYYILKNDILKNGWSWNGCYNIGKWSNYPGYESIFDSKIIYQLINLKFNENSYRIISEKKVDNKTLLDLINWSKI